MPSYALERVPPPAAPSKTTRLFQRCTWSAAALPSLGWWATSRNIFVLVSSLSAACTKLQEHNRKLKKYVAALDSAAAYDAMKGGVLGIGCNDKKLIAATCTRTKAQLHKTAVHYRATYDRDLRQDVKGETGGNYGRMVYYAMASRPQCVLARCAVACSALSFHLHSAIRKGNCCLFPRLLSADSETTRA